MKSKQVKKKKVPRLWAMLDEGCSRSRMLNQTLPSKENNDVLFTLY